MSDPKNYITAEGFEKIKKELDDLWKIERPRVTHEVEVAAAHGDRSENAEYKYGKQRLREIDRRLRFLSKRIEQLKIVRPASDPQGRVVFGSWVRVEDDEGDENSYQLVGVDESDAENGKISLASPIGKALLGKQEGDEIQVQCPKGLISLTVIEVSIESLREPNSEPETNEP